MAGALAGDGVFSFRFSFGVGLYQRTGGIIYGQGGFGEHKIGRHELGYFGEYIRRDNNLDWLDYCGFYNEKGKIVG